MRRIVFSGATFVLLALVMGACGHWPAAEFEPGMPVEDAASREAALRKLVKRHVEQAARTTSEDRHELERSKPYYYKEYSVYPEGTERMTIEIREQDSRSRPYVADITLPKIQYSTRLHRKRQEAVEDDNFLRGTGTETLTYELRNGRWRPVGSLFVAEKTEENINGEWVPLEEEIVRTIEAEERKGWFARQWSKIMGRDD